jgi:hypothetical protein
MSAITSVSASLPSKLEIAGRPKYEEAEAIIKVFISYSYGDEQENKKENIRLAEECIRPLLESLGFKVLTFRKDVKFGNSDEIITNYIETSEVIIGIFTKDCRASDSTWEPKPNIPDEMGRAFRSEDKKVVIPMIEEGVELKKYSNTRALLDPSYKLFFKRDLDTGLNNYGEMLVKLVQGLSKEFNKTRK